jgi:hypothetical protein
VRFVTTVGLLLLLSASTSAQTKPCSTPARVVFTLVQMTVEQTPVTSDADFQPIRNALASYCFQAESPGWSYSDTNAKVLVIAYPSSGAISILLLPHVERSLGDATLAALIDRARVVRASDGDAIDLELPSRPVAAHGRTGTITDRLGFRLYGGAWFRTATTIEWAP